MMNAKKNFWKERHHAVANYPHYIRKAQGPIAIFFADDFGAVNSGEEIIPP